MITTLPVDRFREMSFARAAASAACPRDLGRLLFQTLASEHIEHIQLHRFEQHRYLSSPWNSLPSAYAALLEAAARTGADPLACYAATRPGPCVWNNSSSHTLPNEIKNWLARARNPDVFPEVSVPVHGPYGNCDVFHLWRRKGSRNPLVPEELFTLGATLFIAAMRLNELSSSAKPVSGSPKILSKRELDVLTLCKEGRTYSEIGAILSISTKTVDYHVGNSLRKLGVNDKLSAIIKAIKLGLLDL